MERAGSAAIHTPLTFGEHPVGSVTEFTTLHTAAHNARGHLLRELSNVFHPRLLLCGRLRLPDAGFGPRRRPQLRKRQALNGFASGRFPSFRLVLRRGFRERFNLT